MKRIVLIILCFSVMSSIGYFAYNEFFKQPAKRHIHAGFLVFVDGKQHDFSNIRYMSLAPCEHHAGRLTREEIAHEMAHLHDNVGIVAHSHREGAVWSDLFRNINYTFDDSKPLVGFINSQKVEDVFSQPINAYDSLVILVGNSDEKLVSKAVTKDQIVKVENTSADCGT